jgi:hypothetical protein
MQPTTLTALSQPVALPIHHLNGTGAPTIFDEYSRAHAALTQAIEALSQCTLHQRDFYPLQEDAFKTWSIARDQRAEALNTLRMIQIYAATWASHALDATS